MKQQIFNVLFDWWLKGKYADKIAHIILILISFAIGTWFFDLEYFSGIIGLKEASAFSFVFFAVFPAAIVEVMDEKKYSKGNHDKGGDFMDFIHSLFIPLLIVVLLHIMSDQAIL
jgi:hypothetical protein